MATVETTYVPTTPQNLSSTVSADDITLDWDSVDWGGDQGHYNILRGTSSGSYSEIATVSAGTTTYTDSGLLDGEKYFYVVTAENSEGTSSQSNETSKTTAFQQPSGVSATVQANDQIDLSWTPGETVESFEDLKGWTVHYGGQNTSRVYDGSYSFYADTGAKLAEKEISETGEQIESFSYYYQETSSYSSGGGVRLVNSNGNYEGGTATDNPGFEVDFNSGIDDTGGAANYEEWVYVKWDFDWANGQVDIYYEGQSSGSTYSGTYTLKQGVDVASMELWNYHGGQWKDSGLDMWWDNIRYRGLDNGEYHVQMSRDGASYVDPAGGSSLVGHNTTSESYGPASDNPYDEQVGIDSSFQFRVRAETEHSSSSWVETSTVYTEPIPPHNPSVSRPDANTVEISWSDKSDVNEGVEIEYREDSGSGYGNWTRLDANASPPPASYSVSNGDFVEDARYQFRLRGRRYVDSGILRGEWIYADYGNSGNVYFEDDFESGDLSAWGTQNADVGTSFRDEDSTNISGADEGSYYCHFPSGGQIEKTVDLSSVSSDTQPFVKYAFATYTASSGASFRVEVDGNGTTEVLKDYVTGAENRQGWAEENIIIPESVRESQTTVRFLRDGAKGIALDRVVVSDILHEYTMPAAPSGLSLDASVEDEISATWTNNDAFATPQFHWEEDGGGIDEYTDAVGSSHTVTGLPDGELFNCWVRPYIRQYRHGSHSQTFWDSSHDSSTKSATTVNPPDSALSVSPASDTSLSVSWTDNHDNEDGRRVYYSDDGGSTWTQFSDLGANTTSETITGLSQDTTYDAKTEVYTEHVSSESGTDDATTYLNVTRSATVTGDGGVTATRETMTKPRYSDVTGDGQLSATRDSYTKPRYSDVTGDGNVSATRSGMTKSRTTVLTVTASIDSQQELREVFPDERALDVAWDFDTDPMAFMTEWLSEDSHIPDVDRDGVGVVLGGDLSTTIDVFVQYDRTGDGTADVTSTTKDVSTAYHTIPFDDDRLFGADGYYRVGVRGMRIPDTINQADLGPIHRNF